MKRLLLDILALIGLGTLLLGVHRLSEPAALIVGGGFVVAVSCVARLRR